MKTVERDGMEQLLNWLENSSFFTMPASTRFHGNYEGGLAEHSLNVYHCLKAMSERYLDQFPGSSIPEESIILCALCHDFCKIDFYKKGFRNVKNDKSGQWEKKEIYEYAGALGMGHGEGSVYIVQSFLKLKREEALAIRWHMGAFDMAVKGGDHAINVAKEQTPLVTLLHLADQWASSFMEKTIS